MSRTTLSLTVLVLAGMTATAAVASRRPSDAETAAITKAFKTTTKAGLKSLAKQFDVVRIRVSTVNSHYATGAFVPKPQYRRIFQSGYGVAKRGKNGWKAVDVGSSMVGCGKVPKAVLTDLKLHCR
jgi:hypothetical protein